MLRATVYIATSLDGFIARPDGSLDWLPQDPDDPAIAGLGDDDLGYSALMDSVDALVIGRNTFDVVRGFDGEWPYEKPVIVLTSRATPPDEDLVGRVSFRTADPDELAEQLPTEGIERVYVDGGRTIQSFLRAGLVDRIIVTTIPILIGGGVSLFGQLDTDIRLDHVRTDTWPNGFVQSEYLVA